MPPAAGRPASGSTSSGHAVAAVVAGRIRASWGISCDARIPAQSDVRQRERKPRERARRHFLDRVGEGSRAPFAVTQFDAGLSAPCARERALSDGSDVSRIRVPIQSSGTARTSAPAPPRQTRCTPEFATDGVSTCEATSRCCGLGGADPDLTSRQRSTRRHRRCSSECRRIVSAAASGQPDQLPRQVAFAKTIDEWRDRRVTIAGNARSAGDGVRRIESPFTRRFGCAPPTTPAGSRRENQERRLMIEGACQPEPLQSRGDPAYASASPTTPAGSLRENQERRLVSRDGIEPSTRRLRVCCSAN